MDITKCSPLRPVAKDREGFTTQYLIHEYSYYIPIPITSILPFSIHIMGAEDGIFKPEHFVCCGKLLLHCKLCDTIWVFGVWHEIFVHWELVGPIHRDRTGKN